MLISQVLPADVAAVETFTDPPEATLFPEEAALLTRAVGKRRAEFTTGRHCARTALAAFGLEPAPILVGPGRAPRWPDGFTGSITHCAGYRAAAVARTTVLASIGVDAEPHVPLPSGVLEHISLPAERDHLGALAASCGDVRWDTLLFCAKEAVYKAWHPLTGRWLGFEDALITIDPAAGRFTAQLVTPADTLTGDRLAGFAGRWLTRNGLLITGVAVRSRSSV